MSASELITHLQAEDVPYSTDPCRYCPDPCSDHEAYPSRLTVDLDSQMLGTVKPYGKQCVISTGKTDWEREVTTVKGSFAAELAHAHEALSKPLPKRRKSPSAATTGLVDEGAPRTEHRHPIPGVFNSNESSRLSILNGSHSTIDPDADVETVLVFPDYKLVNVSSTRNGAYALWEEHLSPPEDEQSVPIGEDVQSPGTQSWIIPYGCVILLCSHKRRDNRCAVTAPKLERALKSVLECEGWEVHTQLEHVCLWGSPLQTKDELESAREAMIAEPVKKALIVKTSHIGGHKYAGNVMIYTPARTGIWYGRVTTHNVEPIVQQTIIEGKILPDLLRGGINLTCKRKDSVLAW